MDRKEMRDAASVVLYRRGPPLEVFVVERRRDLNFFGGYLAFPGGAVDPTDRAAAAGGDDSPPDEEAVRRAALRELREEVGLDGVRPESLEPLARFATPGFSPIRFDTRFYLLECSGDPCVRGGELAAGAWRRPEEVLAAWRRSEVFVAPPALVILEALVRHGIDRAPQVLRSLPRRFEGSGLAIPWTPGIELVPLPSPPLPSEIPETTFLAGGDVFVAVDPGPRTRQGQEHLIRAIERRMEKGDRFEAVVLTHHHVDHIGALDAVRARFGVPVWAHPITGELLGTALDRPLEEGDVIELGRLPEGGGPMALDVLFTPGHAAGHIVLHDRRRAALVAGDLVSTLVSMYVGAPGGDLAQYLDSLERIRRLDLRILYPSHGPPTLHARDLIDRTLEHRRERIEEMRGLLSAGPLTAAAAARAVYPEAEGRLRPLVERAARATLEYLVRRGIAERIAEDTYALKR